MDKKSDLTIGICTRNRPKKCLDLLKSLNEKSSIINHIIVVEDTSDKQYLSQKLIEKIFQNSNHIKVIYKNVKYQNVSKSRNLILETTKDTFLILIDDDVCLTKDSIPKTLSILKENEKNTIVIGLLKPKTKNYVSLADGAYYNRERLLYKRKNLPMVPFSFTGINLDLIKKFKIKFDLKFDKPAGEDIDFCLQVTKNKLKIVFAREIVNYHFFDTNLKDFLKKKHGYGKYICALCEKHPEYIYLSYYISTRKIWRLFPHFSILIKSLKTFSYSKKIKMPLISKLILFLAEYTVNKATYNYYFSASTNKLKFFRL